MQESTRAKVEALRQKLTEDYSVASIDDMDRVYKYVERVNMDLGDAIVMAQGVAQSTPLDAPLHLHKATEHLRQAREAVQLAMKAIAADVEGWAAWRDTTI